MPSGVTAFWCPSSKPSADAGHAKALTLYSGSEAEPGSQVSAAFQLSGAASVRQARLTPQCSPASQSLGTHPAHALAMGHASRIPLGKPQCTDRSSHHVLTGPPVTKTVGHVSQFTLGLASDRQTPEAQLASSWAFSLPRSPYDGEGGGGRPAALGHEDTAALRRWLFLVKEQEAEPAVGCPAGVKKPQNPKGK